MDEWALFIFTLAVQASIGGMVVLYLFNLISSKLTEDEAYHLFRMPLIVISVLSLLGLVASFTHLGAPINAFNTIRNIGSSWMSREIVLTGAFIGLTCLTAGLTIVQKKVTPWLMLVTAIVGLVDVYAMGALYATTLVSGWNSINTYTSFFGTTLILGAVLAVSLVAPKLSNGTGGINAKDLIRSAFAVAIFGFAIQVVGSAMFFTAGHEVTMISAVSATTILANYKGMIAFGWIASIIGMFLFGYLAVSKSRKTFVSLTFASLAIFIIAQGLSRYVFYVMPG
ncbi:dimethyl sulfoxide reductase anchor subunit family protein [Sporosarcina ureilytica]|uniref:Cyclic nucleotide-binding protein n=1 Tax=Sporosarcina ureilytica TaxID=298596 RepID=A0A1D8JE09_9BACL|nr:DmsC/YnfH family molybdoenzyme membrane anchor subunit [Sporosarcina ureilytica]AOV06928.1 cyclic nucleotide-binding protein [Sporosarcina ureilytica]